MTDERQDHTDRDEQGDGALGPGTTAGGGVVRAGKRVEDDAGTERNENAPPDREVARD